MSTAKADGSVPGPPLPRSHPPSVNGSHPGSVHGDPGVVGSKDIPSNVATMNGSYGLRPGGTQKVDAAADDSDEEEDEEPADHTFEFTTNLNVFRFLRMIVTLQVLGVMIDNDDIPVPVFFRIVCRGPLFYAIRFYSRPFMDLIYAIQVNQNNVPGASAGLAQGSALLRSGGSGGGASSHRRLSYWSSYREAVEPTPVFYPNIAFLTDRNWHTIQYYGHFFMGLFAVFMAGLFTFSFWELSDYTNRFEMERWLKRYATPKWWRVGGFNVMFAMMRGTLIMSLLVFFLYALCKQFVPKAVPETEMVGGAVALSLMLSFIVTLLALFLLWFANSAFQRYVSQNEVYTSIIILKKCIKVKVEMGLGLLWCLFLPVVYTLCKALVLVEDWDATVALPHRKAHTHFVPCFFMAFPPFKSTRYNQPYSHKPANTTGKSVHRNNDDFVVTSYTNDHKVKESCPMAYYGADTATSVTQATNYYDDQAILTCDSYLGIIMYTTALTGLFLVVCGYFWATYSINKTVYTDMYSTRWAEEILVLGKLQAEDEENFEAEFHWWPRFVVAFRQEFWTQVDNGYENFCWVLDCFFHTAMDWGKFVYAGLRAVLGPGPFLVQRIVISCRRAHARWRSYRRHRRRARERAQMIAEEATVPTYPASEDYFYQSHGTLPTGTGAAHPPGVPGAAPGAAGGGSLATGSDDGGVGLGTDRGSSLSVDPSAERSEDSGARHGGYIFVDSISLAQGSAASTATAPRGHPDPGLRTPGTNPFLSGGFVIGPEHAMDGAAALDLHSQTGFPARPGSPGSPGARTWGGMGFLGFTFTKRAGATAATVPPHASDADPLLLTAGPGGGSSSFATGAAPSALLLAPASSSAATRPSGAVELSNVVFPHSSSLALPGPAYTNALPNAGTMVPIDPSVGPGHGQGQGQGQTLAQLPSALVEEPATPPAAAPKAKATATAAPARKRPGQDDDDDVSLFTVNSRINEDGDEKEEVDFSVPPEEYSVTKTIVRALAYALTQAARPFAFCAEEAVYNETCGAYAIYDKVYACLFPEIDYSQMNAVLAAKVRKAEEEKAMRGWLWGRKEKTAAEEDRDAVLTAPYDGKPALWRRRRTLPSRFQEVRKMERQMRTLQTRLVREYVTDHEMTISLFDSTVDGAGLCLLLCPFRFYRLQWMLVMLAEWSLYASLGPLLNYWVDWQTRTGIIIAISVVFHCVTYLVDPYIEKRDRVLDFTGRVLVWWVGVGHIFCAMSPPPHLPSGVTLQHNDLPLYSSQKSFATLFSLSYAGASTYFFVDLVMVAFLYAYFLYVIRLLGTFQYLHRQWHNFTFALHDHVMNWLMRKIRETTLGFENIYVGVRLITQWDDLIAEQRRFHLLAWPRLDPPALATTFNKLFEIKWAAAFNLTIPNIRSSLGLNVLHTTVYSGDSDIARWIVYRFPHLLLAEDSSRDTPISVALKEAAFFVLESSYLNQGRLDDGTAYDDEAFNQVYPEVEDMREQVAQSGEYVKAFADTLLLTARQADAFKEHGWLDDVVPKVDPRARHIGPDGYPSFFRTREVAQARLQAKNERISASRSSGRGGTSFYGSTRKGGTSVSASRKGGGSSKAASVKSGDGGGGGGGSRGVSANNPMLAALGGSANRAAKEEAKKQAKLQAKLKKQEFISLRRKRYPEDSKDEEYEHGNHPIWAVINLHAPKSTVYKEDAPTQYGLGRLDEALRAAEKRTAAREAAARVAQAAEAIDHQRGAGESSGPANGNGNMNGLVGAKDDDVRDVEEAGSQYSTEVTEVFAPRAWKLVAAAPEALDNKGKRNAKRRPSESVTANAAYQGHPKVEELKFGWGRAIAAEELRPLLLQEEKEQAEAAALAKARGEGGSSDEEEGGYGGRGGGRSVGSASRQTDADSVPQTPLARLVHALKSAVGRTTHGGPGPGGQTRGALLPTDGDGDDVFVLTRAEQARRDRELAVAWKMCKLTEFLLSKEVARVGRRLQWNVQAYKEVNRMANYLQSRLIQQLALVCCFNPPQGFARLSDWARPPPLYLYDERRALNSELSSWLHVAERVVEGPASAAEAVASAVAGLAKGAVRLAQRPFVLRARRRAEERRRLNNLDAPGADGPPAAAASSGWGLQDDVEEEGAEHLQDEARRALHVDPRRLFNDRVIQYLADCAVGRQFVNLPDMELSVCGREAWRAIARALRRKYVTFIVPSVFVAPKAVQLLHLNLARNELDCGDAVLVADAVLYQELLQHLDLSHNRLGARGVMRLCEVMKTSRFMRTLLLAHNRIGPACGPALRALLKNTKSLKVLSLSHNRLGELVRYPNKLQRDRVRSAASDIFVGLRQNKSLEALDVSYNSLGPLLADHVPVGVAKHPRMNALNLAGNGLGADKGAAMLFAMAGEPGGARLTEQRLRMLDELKHEDVATKILQQEEAREAFEEQEKRRKREERLKKVRGADGQVALVPMAGADDKNSLSALLARLAASEAAADGAGGGDNHSSAPSSARSKASTNDGKSTAGKSATSASGTMRTGRRRRRVCRLSELVLADNQLGWLSGHGLARYLTANSEHLTALDVSANSLGTAGVMPLVVALEEAFGMMPKLAVKADVDAFGQEMKDDLDEGSFMTPQKRMKELKKRKALLAAREQKRLARIERERLEAEAQEQERLDALAAAGLLPLAAGPGAGADGDAAAAATDEALVAMEGGQGPMVAGSATATASLARGAGPLALIGGGGGGGASGPPSLRSEPLAVPWAAQGQGGGHGRSGAPSEASFSTHPASDPYGPYGPGTHGQTPGTAGAGAGAGTGKTDSPNRKNRLRRGKVLGCNLLSLNVARNNLGPPVATGLFYVLSTSNCTLTSVNVSNNPLGVGIHTKVDVPGQMGLGSLGAAEDDGSLNLRTALGSSRSLAHLDISHTNLPASVLLTAFGGPNGSLGADVGLGSVASTFPDGTRPPSLYPLTELNLAGLRVDEPCCMQLAYALPHMRALQKLVLKGSRMGPRGAALVLSRVVPIGKKGPGGGGSKSRAGSGSGGGPPAGEGGMTDGPGGPATPLLRSLTHVDLTDALIGPVNALTVATWAAHPACALATLLLGGNGIAEMGGVALAKALELNTSLTDLDLSRNQLTGPVAVQLAKATRGHYVGTNLVSRLQWRKLVLNDNPGIGPKGARYIFMLLARLHTLHHLEAQNVGAARGCCKLLAGAFRDAALTWRFLDLSRNIFDRVGLTHMTWALMHNRSVRVLKLATCGGGPRFGSLQDALPVNGVCTQRMLRANVMLREVDLSHNRMSSEAGALLFDALVDNFTVRKVNLRGNGFDDDIAEALSDLLHANNVVDDLDLGDNEMGHLCCRALALGLEANRALKTLRVDNNRLGNAGGDKLADAFARHLMMNTSLRLLMLQGNKLGPVWGHAMAELLSHNNTLTEVSLKDNRLDGPSAVQLVRAYARAPALIELHLSCEEIGDEAAEALRAVVRRKKALPAVLSEQEQAVQDKMMELAGRGGGEAADYAAMEWQRETKVRESFMTGYYT